MARMVPPVGEPKVRVVAAAAGAQVGDPLQVVAADGVAATCKPEGNESVKFTPVKLKEFELASVKVNVDVPLTAIGLGEKALLMVGGLGIAQPVKVTLSKTPSDPGVSFVELKK